MKKFLTFALVCCLVFSSSSIVFATATQWDTSDQTNLSNIAKALTTTGTGTLLRSVNAILTALTSTTQQGSLYNGVAYLYDIREYASQIASSLNGSSGSFLEKIFNALTHTDAGGIVYSYVTEIFQKVSEIDNSVLSIQSAQSTFNNFWLNNSGRAYNGWVSFNGDNISSLYTGTIAQTAYQNALMTGLFYINNNTTRGLSMLINRGLSGYNSNQNVLNWGSLDTSTFTPSSGIDGIYKYLNTIQAPVARLAYVLANDQEISARNAAAANQTAVVDNFIDSSGSGAAAPSDFGSISNLSSGFKDNIDTDASVSGIWNIFNSDNFGWFSQETADQLDTSGSASRSLRNSGSYPTPLLDQQTEDILKFIGGDNND